MNILPKSFRRLSPQHKLVATALGGAAALAVAFYVFDTKKRNGTVSVQGFFADLAKNLGLSPGAMDVRTAQRYLNFVSGTHLALDGILGPQTKAALMAFQRGNGLPQTGAIDQETASALQYFAAATSSNPALKKLAVALPSDLPQVTYAPHYMPHTAPPPTPTARQIAMAKSDPTTPVPLGHGWMLVGECACFQDDTDCISRCASSPGSPYMTGVQSTSMYDARFHYGF